MKEAQFLEKPISPQKTRIAVAAFFFVSGFGFATWASRIPALQQKLHLSEAELGTALFAMPLGLMLTLPLTSFLLGKFSSRSIMLLGSVAYSILLIVLAFVNTNWQFILLLFLFGASRNLMNIPVNAQSVGVQKLYSKSIISSFHGVWSLAGFVGASFGGLMILKQVDTATHFIVVSIITLVVMGFFYKNTYHDDKPVATTEKRKAFSLPNKALLKIGLIAFACMACEGTMYDWSGVYFAKVVQASVQYQAVGYITYMCAVTCGRFVADYCINNFGIKRVLEASAVLIFIGILLAVIFPNIIVASIGFALTGLGVSSIIPLSMRIAGSNAGNQTSGQAIASVSTVSYFGFLLGPPVIGYIGELANLRWSFSLSAVAAVGILLLLRKINFKGM